MSTYNDLIEILHTICGRDIETPKGLDLGFLDGIIPTELFLSIPTQMKQNALYALCIEASRYRFQSIQEFWNCARDVFLTFPRDNRFNFAEYSAPCGLPTMFLHDVRARNAFREIHPRMKEKALLELHRMSKRDKSPAEMRKFAMDIFNSYATKIDLIVGATIFLPRSIRQDDLLSAEVEKALYAIRSSERPKAVRAFTDELKKQRIFNTCDLQSLAVSTFQEYSSTSTDCSHQQVNFDVEDDHPSTISPTQSSRISSDSSTNDTHDITSLSQSAKPLALSSPSATSEQPATLPSSTQVAKMNSLSDSIPRKKKVIEAKVEEADRLFDIIEKSQEIKLRFCTETQRRELVGKERPCQDLQRGFMEKFGAKVSTKIINLVSEWPSILVDVWLRDYTSSIYKASDDFADKDTALLLKCPMFRGKLEDHLITTGCAVGPTAFPCRIKRGSKIDVFAASFCPNLLGESSIEHMDKTHGMDGIFNTIFSELLGLETLLNAGYFGFNAWQVRLPRDSLTRLGKLRGNIPEDHKLILLLNYIDDCSKALLDEIVPTLLSTTLSNLGVVVKAVLDRRSAGMKFFHDITEILKKNLPNLEMIDLGHPTEFAKETKPSVEKYDNLISTFVDIFVSYAESFECDVDEILGRLTDDDIQDVFEVFKMGNGPTSSVRNKELAAQNHRLATKEKISNALTGRRLSQATKEKISNALTGRRLSQATKEKISNVHTGRRLSQATKDKMSIAHTGKRLSQAHIEKIQNSRSGYRHSEATKEKMSKSSTGYRHSEATKEKISKSSTGKRHSQATKEKMSKSSTGKRHSQATKEKVSKARTEFLKRKKDDGSRKKNASKKRRK